MFFDVVPIFYSDCAVEDVLKARLKTLGVVEHQFTINTGNIRGAGTWVIYDVGGARSQRHAWAPYFEDG
jgi:G-protein alpha subunit